MGSKFVKLTSIKGGEYYIRKKWIVGMFRDPRGHTVVCMAKGDIQRYWVKEMPDEIMKMLEEDEQ